MFENAEELNAELANSIEEQRLNYFSDINLIGSICRVCLESDSNKTMINIFEIKESQIPLMIMACGSVQVAVGDGLPNVICNTCFVSLYSAWQFRLRIENSDTRLKQCYYKNNRVCQIPVELEDTLNNIFLSDSTITPLENVKEEFSEMNDNNIKPGLEHKSDVEKIKQQSDKNENPEVHQCDECYKTFHKRKYLTQHLRIHTGEKPYTCNLCHKRFVNSGHLTIHLRTHTGEKPHNCTLCPKAFSTRQELKKHTMVHQGERPFACNLCTRIFGSSSNLYAHLKHHTGEKNFTCEICGKPFYTKQELKQHMVVHTGEKPYLCEYCNKRFAQIAHLRRHYKMHKC